MFKMNMKDNFEAQAWAMLWGLKFSWELGLRHVVVESDCGDLVDLVGNSGMQEDEQLQVVQEIEGNVEEGMRSACRLVCVREYTCGKCSSFSSSFKKDGCIVF